MHSTSLPFEIAASAAAFVGADALLATTTDPTSSSRLAVALLASLAWPLALQHAAPGRLSTHSVRELLGLVVRSGLLPIPLLCLAAAFGAPLTWSFVAVFASAQFGALVGVRLLVGRLERSDQAAGERFLLVVGSGPRAVALKRSIEANPSWGLQIVGYLDDSGAPISEEISSSAVHKLVEIREILRSMVIDEVVVAAPRSLLPQLPPVLAACREAGIPVALLSDLFGDCAPPPEFSSVGALSTLRFSSGQHGRYLILKRALDLVGGSLALALSAPFIGLAAIAIAATSRGPVFFRQTRCGLHGRRFEMLKLRTMTADAEEKLASLAHLNEMSGPVFKIKDDPRVTPIGAWLRRFSIDELPQLWNVVRGDMSLVGPRPPIPREVAQYSTNHQRRLAMRPGLTGAWQVGGRNRVSDFAEWVKLDLEYIDNWSIALDLKILLRTVPAVVNGTGE